MTTVVCPPDPRLTGVWRRSLLIRPDGTSDVTSSVTWVQAGSRYVDLRLPRPGAGPVEGFAGQVRAEGRYTCWDRLVDLHPESPPDVGLLELDDTALVETGRSVRYLERWHRIDGWGPGRRPPWCAVELREVSTGARALLVRVGDDVGWARGAGVDAEIALGIALDDGVLLSASNLPGRSGARLQGGAEDGFLVTVDPGRDGALVSNRWVVLDVEGSPEALPFHPPLRGEFRCA